MPNIRIPPRCTSAPPILQTLHCPTTHWIHHSMPNQLGSRYNYNQNIMPPIIDQNQSIPDNQINRETPINQINPVMSNYNIPRIECNPETSKVLENQINRIPSHCIIPHIECTLLNRETSEIPSLPESK